MLHDVHGTYEQLFCIGFGEIMGTLSRIGLFEPDPHPLLKDGKRPTFRKFLSELLKIESEDLDGPLIGEKVIHERIIKLGYCKDQETALRAAKTITYAHCICYPFFFPFLLCAQIL